MIREARPEPDQGDEEEDAEDRLLLDPVLHPLFGCNPVWTEGEPPAGEPCPVCGAIRDELGNVVDVELIDDQGEPVTVRTGIQDRHPFVCVRCTAVPRAVARRLHRSLPRSKLARRAAQVTGNGPRSERLALSKRDRRAVARTPAGRAWLAQLAAEDAGERGTARAIAIHLEQFTAGAMTAAALAKLYPAPTPTPAD